MQSPLPGVIESVQNNGERLDYGPTVIVRHQSDEGAVFHTLYGHLSLATLGTGGARGRGSRAGDLLGLDRNLASQRRLGHHTCISS